MADFPLYIWILVFAGAAGIPAVTAYGLYRSALANGRGRGRAAALAAGFGGLWAAWIAASAVLAATGAYRPGSGANRPWIAVAAAGVLAVTVAAAATPAARRVLTGTRALAWLTAPQALRVVGISFILAMMLGKLPAAFALPAGLGDIAVGIAAPRVAARLARGDRRGALWFNVLGIADLVIAVTLGFLGGLGPDRLGLTPSTADLGLLPLALIPSTAVPLALALHVTALARLRRLPVRAAGAERREGLTLTRRPDADAPA